MAARPEGDAGLAERTLGQLQVPLGGPATIVDRSQDAFGFPFPTIAGEARRAFAVGNSFFRQNWVAAPASAAGRDGLGPLFNARSCSTCHALDGRGHPPEASDRGLEGGLVLRLGIPGPGADLDEPHYGGQLQDQALLGLEPEGQVQLTWQKLPGRYADGQAYELLEPSYRLFELNYGPLSADLRLGARLAPQLIGLGLLASIDEAELLASEDPQDRDRDGISGRVHRLPGSVEGAWFSGRFGWKATQPTVLAQVAAAFVNDIGITSPLHPAEALSATQLATLEFSSGGAPEIEAQKLERVAFYCEALAVPAQRDADVEAVQQGALRFEEFGCSACHRPLWSAAATAAIPAFRGAEFRPYTDLLLHDLGPGLADQKHDGQALPAEWRTPPLWGLGLVETVGGRRHLLHDGRARDFAEAILWHGGEAEGAQERFRGANSEQRDQLLRFLSSL